MNLNELIQSNAYETDIKICKGCDNQCTVRCFRFANGNTYFSGNNCEKIYANMKQNQYCGVNMQAEKYHLLFDRKNTVTMADARGTIGIPRGLGIYENYPFWHALFTACGFRVCLSPQSTNQLYESGIRSIMADNICFPAKLMHGHICRLVAAGVDRIFYPYVVYEQKEDAQAKNSFNCPIVAGYSDVLKSAMDTVRQSNIPIDAPVVSFNNRMLLEKSCTTYLRMLGVDSGTAQKAIAQALEAQYTYRRQLIDRNMEVLRNAEVAGRRTILLAGRPYHADPLIEHKIAQAIADMGLDVLTEHVASDVGSGVYDELNAVSQWAYPNRIFKAAYFAGRYTGGNMQMVELTSFGCGPDAFILDEVNTILKRYGKNLTILKIDDVNNIGSLRLRVRSLVESTESVIASVPKPRVTTKTFVEADRRRTILAPFFAEGYSEFVPSLFRLAGYTLVNLPLGNQADAETGLRFANNDICYPATIVVGSIMNALQSGRYDRNDVAVIITQTGGQCRASNYYALIKNAMASAGLADIPVLSLATSDQISNSQPGFRFDWKRMARIVINTMLYADCLNKLYFASVVREREMGAVDRLRRKYIAMAFPLIEADNSRGLRRLMGEAVHEFIAAIDTAKQLPTVGLVGEIYVKYNGFSNKFTAKWLMEQGVEVVPPALLDFFSTSFVAAHQNKLLNIRQSSMPTWITDAFYAYIRHCARRFDKICSPFPFYRAFVNIFDNARLAANVLSLAADFGEGWLLPGEVCHLAESGVYSIVSLQPFGCIANHIISKGVEKRLQQLYPQLNLLFLDFDSSTSDANIFNRLYFLMHNNDKAV